MQYNPIGWVEIPVTDMERAQHFYETLLGISLQRQDIPGYEMSWFPWEREAPGCPGALMKGMGYVPNKGGPVIYFTCPDLDAALERAKELKATIMLPKKDIGEYGFIAWVEDSEGNVAGLLMPKKAA